MTALIESESLRNIPPQEFNIQVADHRLRFNRIQLEELHILQKLDKRNLPDEKHL